jgi:hypothetical protein
MQQSKSIGILLTIAGLMIATTVFTSINPQHAYSDANCDKADSTLNPQGNERGNTKDCGFSGGFGPGPKEPIRECDSPNHFKDNNGDGNSGCRERGTDRN